MNRHGRVSLGFAVVVTRRDMNFGGRSITEVKEHADWLRSLKTPTESASDQYYEMYLQNEERRRQEAAEKEAANEAVKKQRLLEDAKAKLAEDNRRRQVMVNLMFEQHCANNNERSLVTKLTSQRYGDNASVEQHEAVLLKYRGLGLGGKRE